MEEHPKPSLPCANSNDMRPTTIIPPLPSGFLWRAFPISCKKAIVLFGGFFFLSFHTAYVLSVLYPCIPTAMLFAGIISIPAIVMSFAILWGIPHLILMLIYRLRFKASLPPKPYIAEFILVILIALLCAGDTIYENIDRPVKSLQRALMDGKPLPASVRNIEYFYWHSVWSGSASGWAFEIDPADLPKLLQTRKYILTTKNGGFERMDMDYIDSFPDTSKLPKEPMVNCYSNPTPINEGAHLDIWYTRIFTDKTGSKIIVLRYYIR